MLAATCKKENTLLNAALKYAQQGLKVFPLHNPLFENGDISCSCSKGKDCNVNDIGKHPRTRHGVKDATTKEDIIKDWWEKWPDANIGIAMGNGLVALDEDPRHSGDDTRAELEKEYGELPDTPKSITGDGGYHYIFKYENSNSIKNKTNIAQGLDIRSDGGYIVAPSSLHKSGNKYEWEIEPDEMESVPMPEWLVKLATKKPKKNKINDNVENKILEGNRNTILTSFAGSMRNTGLSKEAIKEALLKENVKRCDPPLSEIEINKIAQSISRYEPQQEKTPLDFIVPVSEFLEEDIPAPKALISPWLFEGGLNLIVAPCGVGKSWLAMMIDVAITRRRNPARPGIPQPSTIGPWSADNLTGVFYIDGECSEHTLQYRLKNLTKNFRPQKTPFSLLSSSRLTRNGLSLNLTKSPNRDFIFNYLKEHQEYRLLVLDNISSLCPGLDELRKEHWDPINQWLIKLRHEGVAVIVIHHVGKNEKKGLRGHSGIGDIMDSIIQLKNLKKSHEKEAYFEVKFTKPPRYYPPKADLSSFTIKIITVATGAFRWFDGKTKKDSNDNEIIALLLQKDLIQKEIAKKCNVSESQVTKIKKQAVKKGLLTKDGKKLTPEGNTWLSNYKEENE